MENNITQLVRENIQKLKPYSSARDEFEGDAEVYLDANENPFGTFNRYPDPYQRTLKKKLSEWRNISEENLFLGNGSDEVIDLLFRVFCEPKVDRVLTFTPSYGMYQVSAGIQDIKLDTLPLTHDFQIDENKTIAYLKEFQPKIIFACSPNNPTGNLLKTETLLNLLCSFQGILVVDEAYIDFSVEKSLVPLIAENPRLIISQTLSKSWGLAGLRLGMAFANTEIISWLNKVKPPYNISQANQLEALKVLENKKLFETQITSLLKARKLLEKTLITLPNVQHIFPSEANFLLVQFDNAEGVFNALIKANIIVRNRTSQVKDALRITVGSPTENKKLIQTLQQIA